MNRTFAVLLAVAAAVVLRAMPVEATWVGANCHHDSDSGPPITRDEARTYGERAAGEGYNWGGGCWDNDCCSADLSATSTLAVPPE